MPSLSGHYLEQHSGRLQRHRRRRPRDELNCSYRIWHRIWHVTLPGLRTVIVIMLLLQLIGATQVFAEPFLFTGGGPQNATVTVLVLLYRYAFTAGDYGAATALGVLLAVFLAALSAVYLLVTRKWSDA